MRHLYFGLSLLWSVLAGAEQMKHYCSISYGNDESTFRCLDTENQLQMITAIEPIFESVTQHDLEEAGFQFIPPEEYAVRIFNVGVSSTYDMRPNSSCVGGEERFQNVAHSNREFNSLASNSQVVKNLRDYAKILHEVGVCDLPLPGSFGISNHDQLIEHFLCMTDVESTIGKTNIGQGGRGPWGISPEHTLRKGQSYNGRRLEKDGSCLGTKATVRDGSGKEIKQSSAYDPYDVRYDNGKCAMIVYRERKLAPWGPASGSWGSNKKCRDRRSQMNFSKYLGALSCCSAACKAKHSDLKEI